MQKNKSSFVIFRPSQKKLNSQINIGIHNYASNSDTSLKCKDNVKFLGVLIDKNLTSKYHIDFMPLKLAELLELHD